MNAMAQALMVMVNEVRFTGWPELMVSPPAMAPWATVVPPT
jgi:hypothetical protein